MTTNRRGIDSKALFCQWLTYLPQYAASLARSHPWDGVRWIDVVWEGTIWKNGAGIIVGLMLFMPMAAAQFARQEIVTIQSITISDDDFLQGKTEGKPVTIAGRLLCRK